MQGHVHVICMRLYYIYIKRITSNFIDSEIAALESNGPIYLGILLNTARSFHSHEHLANSTKRGAMYLNVFGFEDGSILSR
jgi:hypothetical protein